MLKLKVIACDVLNREISFLSSTSKCYVDVTFLHQGLHSTPDKLRTKLQEEIDRANEGFPYNHFDLAPNYDYIIIGYGLCSNGIVGISSSKIPLVIPRGHDCITLLLGSKMRYKEYFDSNPGTYWYSIGWIERSIQPGEDRYKYTYQEYLNKYGEDNAEYLMEMEQGWFTEYRNAACVTWDCLGYSDYCMDYTTRCAKFLNWNCEKLDGDMSLMKNMMNAEFNENEVLIVPPEKKVVQSYDENIIKFE